MNFSDAASDLDTELDDRHTPPPLPGRPPNARMITTGATPTNDGTEFDIVANYKRLLAEDSELTMPVAAIEALVLALAHTPSQTVSETLDLLQFLTAKLKRGIPNNISLSAGTDLFLRYIVTTLNRPSQAMGNAGAPMDFDHVRNHLVRNGRLFVERAKEARDKIAGFGRHFIRDGHTVLTNGGSRVVGALLKSAAECSGGYGSSSSVRFRVIYVVDPLQSDTKRDESAENIAALRSLGVPVAAIPPTAVAYCLSQVTACFVGAEGVVENGGIISRLGTYQMGMLAKSAGKPFYVVAESHKFVRLYPLGQADLGIQQNIVAFKSSETGDGSKHASDIHGEKEDEGFVDMDTTDANVNALAGKQNDGQNPADAVDFTPPNFISGIITESGVLLPSAVSEELIKIWF